MITTPLALAGLGIFALAAVPLLCFLLASLRRDRLTHRSSFWNRRRRKFRDEDQTMLEQHQLDLESKSLEGMVIWT